MLNGIIDTLPAPSIKSFGDFSDLGARLQGAVCSSVPSPCRHHHFFPASLGTRRGIFMHRNRGSGQEVAKLKIPNFFAPCQIA
jgi:hypothetical protein